MNSNVYQIESGPTQPTAERSRSILRSARTSRPIQFRRLKWFVFVWLLFGLPIGLVHVSAIGLVDTPGATPVSATHGIAAAGANFFGPWSGHLARVVQFPNAGLRNFNLALALGLTAAFCILAGVGLLVEHRAVRWAALILFAVLMPIWYGYGFLLIADGLL